MPINLDFLKSPAAQLAARTLGGGAIGAGLMGGIGELGNNSEDPQQRAEQRKRNLLLGLALGGTTGAAYHGYDKLVSPEVNTTPPPHNPREGHDIYNNSKLVFDALGKHPVYTGGGVLAAQQALENKNLTYNSTIMGKGPTHANLTYAVPGKSTPIPEIQAMVDQLQGMNLPGKDLRDLQGLMREAVNSKTVSSELANKIREIQANLKNPAIAGKDADSILSKIKEVLGNNETVKAQEAAAAAALKENRSMYSSMDKLRGFSGEKDLINSGTYTPQQLKDFADTNFQGDLNAAKTEITNRLLQSTQGTDAAHKVNNMVAGQYGDFSRTPTEAIMDAVKGNKMNTLKGTTIGAGLGSLAGGGIGALMPGEGSAGAGAESGGVVGGLTGAAFSNKELLRQLAGYGKHTMIAGAKVPGTNTHMSGRTLRGMALPAAVAGGAAALDNTVFKSNGPVQRALMGGKDLDTWNTWQAQQMAEQAKKGVQPQAQPPAQAPTSQPWNFQPGQFTS